MKSELGVDGGGGEIDSERSIRSHCGYSECSPNVRKRGKAYRSFHGAGEK